MARSRTLYVSDVTHRRLKILAASRNRSMGEVVGELVEREAEELENVWLSPVGLGMQEQILRDVREDAALDEAEALKLSVEDRARLARRLLESLDEKTVEDRAAVERAWQEEIERRVAEYDAGSVSTTGASDVFSEARKRLRGR